MSRNSLDESLTTLIQGPEIQDRIVKTFRNKGILIKYTGDSSIEVNERKRILTLKQARKDDWFLIEDSNLENFSIRFNGAKSDKKSNISSQRFNKFGLTGCLTIYNSLFKNTSLFADKGSCEDVINLVSSKGEISTLSVDFAAYDALDIDFSEISIDQIDINKAGNDCIDVSSGIYSFSSAVVKFCGDKALSVGESSYLLIESLKILEASIGLSSKDSSIVDISSIETKDTDICLESKRKKQEFNGALINLSSNKCNSEYVHADKYSKILIKEESEL